VASCLAPAAVGGVRGLDGVAQVFAVAFADLSKDLAVRRDDSSCVAGIGPCLLATDEELGRAIDRRPADGGG